MAEPAALRAERLFHVHAAAEGSVVALRGLDLAVEHGEVVAIVGPSGSGKTTLLRVLAGLAQPTAGRLEAFGLSLHDAPRRIRARYRAREVGIVQQHYFRALSPHLTVNALVALKPALLGWPARRRRERAHELLEQVGLRDRAEARRTELSGGEQQRVAVCAALAARPRLLLADEPTGELDERTGHDVATLIGKLAREHRATVVLVTHDPAAAAIADRVLTMRDGRFVTERAGRAELSVVDPSGLVRLEPGARERAGIGDRARQIDRDGRIELSAAGAPAPAHAAPAIHPQPSPARDTGARPAAVAVRQLTRAYDSGAGAIRALDGVTIEFEPGRFHAVVGPSGSGKTTLLHLIAGLDRPTAGTVSVNGQDLAALSRDRLARYRRATLGIVGQSSALVPFLTATESVAIAAQIRGCDQRDAAAIAQTALSQVGMHERAGQRADALSGGERQRLAIAKALAGHPTLLLADEPTASIDQANAQAIAELLAQLAGRGVTVICATHDPVIIGRAERRATLTGGRLHDAC